MKCFNHSQYDAVGICKHCQKGLCNECLTVTTGGVACTATCVDIVTGVDNLIRKNVSVSKSKVLLITPVFLMVIGGSFLYTGIRLINEGMDQLSFTVFIGIFMILWGLIASITVLKRINGKSK